MRTNRLGGLFLLLWLVFIALSLAVDGNGCLPFLSPLTSMIIVAAVLLSLAANAILLWRRAPDWRPWIVLVILSVLLLMLPAVMA